MRGQGVQQKQKLSLEPGGSAVVRLGLKATGPLTARLPDDALAEDSVLQLPEAPAPEVTVAVLEGLDAEAGAALRRFFQVAPGVKLATDGKLRFGPPGSAAAVTVGAKGTLRSFVGPFFSAEGRPAARRRAAGRRGVDGGRRTRRGGRW